MNQEKVDEVIARFPETFGIRAFPGKVFSISRFNSYWNGREVMLYTQRKEGDNWLDFCKGTERELSVQIVKL